MLPARANFSGLHSNLKNHMASVNPPREYLEAKAHEAAFDAQRQALAARCKADRAAGLTFEQIANQLNSEGVLTKTGKTWTFANVSMLIKNPNPPKTKPSKAAARREQRADKKRGVSKRNDKNLGWVAERHPEFEQWRRLASEWLHGREAGVDLSVKGANALIQFLVGIKAPANPATILLSRTPVPDFYETLWGKTRTKGKIDLNNRARDFIEWILNRPEFCEEDDDGIIQRCSAFRNPVAYRTSSGLPRHDESVRSTLPYGYIDELRQLIAQGADFCNWKWAQNAMGWTRSGRGRATTTDANQDIEDIKVAPVWFEVDPQLIDRSDPDCVWRTRERIIPSRLGRRGGQGKKRETIYEMWSPVRWVALLVKLQLPLRTLQVRMLDSGEADTWKWQSGQWLLNDGPAAIGSEKQPYSNGIFLRPNRLVDGNAKVLLHINTNKTADREKAGCAKGYNVPWIIGGPLHQDPFYWLEKLRRWQEKYNPIFGRTKWFDLDGRHIPLKSDVQLSGYPDTTFLFRTPETRARDGRGDLPLTILALERPWFLCLEELERRLDRRKERMPNGHPIRLILEKEHRETNANGTLFSLHSLRVSLITALALDGQVPLAILQKIAGHSRLVMTLYYTKPGAQQSQEAIQAGVALLNEMADQTILDWLANAEYEQLVREVVTNSPESFRAAVPEQKHLRSPAGWMTMVDGLCLVGGNNVELDAPGCHNGGPNIGNETAPRYAPVQGGARNCPMCRWFITRPYFLPQLAARWNNVSYHCYDAREQVVVAEERFREWEDRRAEALGNDQVFPQQKEYVVAQRTLEQAIQKFDVLTQTVAAITRLMERCKAALSKGDGTSLMAVGSIGDFQYAIEEVDSELLQVSGVCEGTLLYPDLDPGKAVLRRAQLLDAALVRDNLPPVFMMLSEEEQKLSGSAYMRELAVQMNPRNPALGRYEVIKLIDARQSLRERLGGAVEEALQIAVHESAPHVVVPIKQLAEPAVA